MHVVSKWYFALSVFVSMSSKMGFTWDRINVLTSDCLCMFPKLQILIYFYLQKKCLEISVFFYLKVQKLPQNLACGGKIRRICLKKI